jgi:hypothetical protein
MTLSRGSLPCTDFDTQGLRSRLRQACFLGHPPYGRHQNSPRAMQSPERHTYKVDGVRVVFVRTEWGGQWACEHGQGDCEPIKQATVWMTLRDQRESHRRLN